MGFGKKKRGAYKNKNKVVFFFFDKYIKDFFFSDMYYFFQPVETTKEGEEKKQKYFDERKPYADIERDNENFKSYYQVSQRTMEGKKYMLMSNIIEPRNLVT